MLEKTLEMCYDFSEWKVYPALIKDIKNSHDLLNTKGSGWDRLTLASMSSDSQNTARIWNTAQKFIANTVRKLAELYIAPLPCSASQLTADTLSGLWINYTARAETSARGTPTGSGQLRHPHLYSQQYWQPPLFSVCSCCAFSLKNCLWVWGLCCWWFLCFLFPFFVLLLISNSQIGSHIWMYWWSKISLAQKAYIFRHFIDILRHFLRVL